MEPALWQVQVRPVWHHMNDRTNHQLAVVAKVRALKDRSDINLLDSRRPIRRTTTLPRLCITETGLDQEPTVHLQVAILGLARAQPQLQVLAWPVQGYMVHLRLVIMASNLM